MKTSTVTLIIGGSSGMGLAAAKKMVAQGISTVILGNNNDKLNAAKIQLDSISTDDAIVETLQANLYEQQDVE